MSIGHIAGGNNGTRVLKPPLARYQYLRPKEYMGAKAPLTGYQYLRPKARGYRALGRTVSPPPTWTGDPFLAHRYFRFLLYGMEAATSGGLQAGNNFTQDAAQVFGRAATDQIEILARFPAVWPCTQITAFVKYSRQR